MEFKVLKKITGFFDYKEKKKNIYSKEKYSKILNNLLGINVRSDSAIFTKISKNNKDLTNLIDEKDLANVYKKTEFKIKIKNINFFLFKKKINKIKTKDEMIHLMNDFGFSISNSILKKIDLDIEKTKKEILEKVENINANFLTQWKKYKKEVNDSFAQNNIWSLYIGTYFIKGKVGDKIVHAPLVLKSVDIEIIDNDVYIISRDENVIMNDKLIFLIENEININFPELNENIDRISFEKIIEEFNYFFKNIITNDFVNLFSKFDDLKTQDINNHKLTKTNGILLMQSHPSGGSLRKATLDLIESGKIDDILHYENQLEDFNKKSINDLINNDEKIFRVCKTDASQERAIIASLKGHSIIIGPPGTGKSQTIANLLTNILAQNKKALFISQKRVALEVVVERMNDLQFFMLQLVEDNKKTNKDEKSSFYDRLNKFISLSKEESTDKKNKLNPLINNEIRKYWNAKEMNKNLTQEEINLFCKIKEKVINGNLTPDFFKKIFDIFSKLKQIHEFKNIDDVISLRERSINLLAEKLSVEKKSILGFIKYFDKSFKTLFDINIEILNFLDKVDSDSSLIKDLKNVSSQSNLNEFLFLYDYFKEEIKSTNDFKSDEENVINIIKQLSKKNIQLIFDKTREIDKSWSRKFLGRIERGFTTPQNFIRLFKEELKGMFNIVVSTPESLSNFVDFKKDKYDYVIFDEASQIFVEKAIPYISVGKKIIIAGDEQQMQPSNWFSNRFENENSDSEDIENIDSLLSYGIANYLPKYNLELNYRSSSASLTTFSSKHFYESNLKTLDKNCNRKKPIEIINVNGEWINNTNIKEAEIMVDCLKNNFNSYKKIILLTLNKNQMELVNDYIANTEPEYYQKIIDGKIILKNLENIQGDEADLVIISIGYTKDTALASTYVGRKGGKNALNVAITRAKESMIVLKSINSKEININNENNVDLMIFKHWISFLELEEEQQKEYSLVGNLNNRDVESLFEHDVYNWLINQSFNKELKLVTQFPIGSYRVDLAILDNISGSFLLGIEVDGFKYHSTTTQKYNDIIRQNFIESKGYKIIRISEILWKTNKNSILEKIKKFI